MQLRGNISKIMAVLTTMALTLFSAIAACSSEVASPRSEESSIVHRNSGQTKSVLPGAQVHDTKPDKQYRPTSAVVICRDIAGYFGDCGCSGDAGGVARFRRAAHGTGDMTVMFVGRTLFPRNLEKGERGDGLLTARKKALLASADVVWKALDKVLWLPDATELESVGGESALPDGIRSRIVRPEVVAGPFRVEAQQAAVLAGRIDVNGERLHLPTVDSRGRNVLVIASYGNSESDSIVLNRTLGSLVGLARRRVAVQAEVERIMKKTPRVWTYWGAYVDPSLEEEDVVRRAVIASDVLLSHNGDGQAATVLPYPFEQLDGEWIACASCHAAAYQSWLTSKHRSAHKVLNDRGRGTDPRCVSCHVQKFMVTGTAINIAPGHGAVTCMSCHRTSSPKDACADCHNSVTDPARKYLAMLRSICAGGTSPRTEGSCNRSGR